MFIFAGKKCFILICVDHQGDLLCVLFIASAPESFLGINFLNKLWKIN